MATKLRVFLSHSGSDDDKGLVEGIDYLARDKSCLDLYIAERKKDPGRDIIKKVEKALKRSHCLWALLTPNGNASQFVQNEIGAAYILGLRIIPMVQEKVKLRGMLYGKESVSFSQTNQVVPFADTVDYLVKHCNQIRREKSSDSHVKALKLTIKTLSRLASKQATEVHTMRMAVSNAIRKDKHLWDLGCELADQGRHAAAEALFEKYIEIHPYDAEAHFNLGHVHGVQGKLEEAKKEYREAIRLKPDDADAHNNLGVVLKQKGEIEGAIKEYREAIRLKPAKANAHYNLGNALRKKGETGVAIKEYREAIRLKPDYALALFELATILDLKGQGKEARRYWERALVAEKRPERIARIKKRLAEKD